MIVVKSELKLCTYLFIVDPQLYMNIPCQIQVTEIADRPVYMWNFWNLTINKIWYSPLWIHVIKNKFPHCDRIQQMGSKWHEIVHMHVWEYLNNLIHLRFLAVLFSFLWQIFLVSIIGLKRINLIFLLHLTIYTCFHVILLTSTWFSL